jgi:hypothetical protein
MFTLLFCCCCVYKQHSRIEMLMLSWCTNKRVNTKCSPYCLGVAATLIKLT